MVINLKKKIKQNLRDIVDPHGTNQKYTLSIRSQPYVTRNSIRSVKNFQDQKLFRNITGPTSRGIDVKVYDKCLMCCGFEPRDGAKENGKARKYILNSCSHYSLFPGEILFCSSWSSCRAEDLKALLFTSENWILSAWLSHLLPPWWLHGRTRRKEGDKMSEGEGGREKESEISLQALVSSRPLALPHWDFVYRRT